MRLSSYASALLTGLGNLEETIFCYIKLQSATYFNHSMMNGNVTLSTGPGVRLHLTPT